MVSLNGDIKLVYWTVNVYKLIDTINGDTLRKKIDIWVNLRLCTIYVEAA